MKTKTIVDNSTKFLSNQDNVLKRIGHTVVLTFVYIHQALTRHNINTIFSKKILILGIIFIFSMFSYSEVNEVYKNSFNNSLFFSFIDKEQKIITENTLPEIKLPVKAGTEPDFKIAAIREKNNSPELILSLNNSALISTEVDLDMSQPLTRTKVEKYIVQSADTIISIAEKFGISVDSILWENNLTLYTARFIKPGETLMILPINGLRHKVKNGDTIDTIAKKYKTSSQIIIEFNNLADSGDIFINDEILIPNAIKPKPKPKPRKIVPRATQEDVRLVETPSSYKTWAYSSKRKCHRFYPGQCTSWAAYKWATELGVCTTWVGHAKSWMGNARSKGFKIGTTPKKGAIILLKESGWAARIYGHVAYVESFDDKYVYFSEMNFKGAWKVTHRKYKLDSWRVLGYIYPY
ncbi:LysM peptidoglycan-binding domain-containing protein [Patescibacteria group bacterium]|nr:LysM peptidoglycan-binding domain-containing protein [Patescibacteria group bacterium]